MTRKIAHGGQINSTGLPWTDDELNLDVPFDKPADRREYVHELWVKQYEQEERDRAADATQLAADMGRALLEREDDELEAMRFGPEVSELMTIVIPDRAARRVRAAVILDTIRSLSRLVELRHGTVWVDPPAPEMANAVREYAGEIGDLLDELEAAHNSQRLTQPTSVQEQA